MGEHIRIRDILNIFQKRLLLIVFIPLMTVLITGIVSYKYLTPIYEAQTQLLINQTKHDQQMGSAINVQGNLELINTYRVIIKSRAILDLVKSELNLKRSVKELSEQIKVSSEQNSQVVTITVQDPDLNKAVEIANTIAYVFQNEVIAIMNIDNVSILSTADEESSWEPIKPRPILNMLIAFTASFLFMIGLALLLEYFDDTVKSEDDIKSYLEIPILGSIPIQAEKNFQVLKGKNTYTVGGRNQWGFLGFLKRKKK